MFALTVSLKDAATNTEKTGKLNLVDLAGSEKVCVCRRRPWQMGYSQGVRWRLQTLPCL